MLCYKVLPKTNRARLVMKMAVTPGSKTCALTLRCADMTLSLAALTQRRTICRISTALDKQRATPRCRTQAPKESERVTYRQKIDAQSVTLSFALLTSISRLWVALSNLNDVILVNTFTSTSDGAFFTPSTTSLFSVFFDASR